MKRDMELVRKILLAMESAEKPAGHVPVISGAAAADVIYPCRLLIEAGLIKELGTSTDFAGWHSGDALLCLTWAGHEFLDAARDPTIWERAKSIGAKAGGLAFQNLLPLLIDLAAQKIGLKPPTP